MTNETALEQQPVILIVDDDPAQRLLLTEVLEQAGFIVVEASDGLEALKLFVQDPPDLVLMDIKMPVMNGLEACAGMRQLPRGKDIPIVLVTGAEDHESIRQAFEVDATDFITKPVIWPILSHRVRYLLKASAAFKKLRRSERQLSHTQKIAAMGNWEWDIVRSKFRLSDQMYPLFGINQQEFDGSYDSFFNLIHPDDKIAVEEAFNRTLNVGCLFNIDHRIILPDNSERVVQQQGELAFSDEGKPVRMRGAMQDISKRKIVEEQIRHLAYYDVLTGLPNRAHFKEHADRTLMQARNNGTKVALMFLDLDEFKRINDTLGHGTGDELLKCIAQKLATGIRASDSVAKLEQTTPAPPTLSRLGGDEFTILFDGFVSAEQIAHVGQRILDQLSEPVVIGTQELVVTCSIGVAVFPDDGEDVDALMRYADIAMYQAKQDGKNNFQFYSKQKNTHTTARLDLETRLRRALERDQLVLHYQPQVLAKTGGIIGLEALIRWQDPETGLVPPNKFIPIAEESGLILPIGEWVMQTACNQAASWQKNGFKPMKMSVNLASDQFRQHNFTQNVLKCLERSGLSPHFLELEMTESTLMQQIKQTVISLNSLKEMGVTLAIDDFGTGYSSMSYLKKFPLDTLKIDRSFIADMTTNDSDASIVKAIIALAKSLGLTSIAEGVELEEQLIYLCEMECDQIQGYFYSRPLPANEMEQYLLANGAVSANCQQKY